MPLPESAPGTSAPFVAAAAIVGVMFAAVVFVLLHNDHYRERRLQLVEHEIEGVKMILTGRHGRTA